MNRYFLILPLLALLGAGGFSLIRGKENGGSRGGEGRRDGRVSGFQSGGENVQTEVGDTKHRIRPDHPEQTIEETEELLRTTIIPAVDFPEDQLAYERLERLNELIQKADIKPHQLRVSFRRGNNYSETRFKHGVRLRNASLAVVLRYYCDATTMRYQVCENGLVQLLHQRDLYYEVPPEVAVPEKKEPWTGEVDEFGEPVREYDECDPFAEK